MIIMTSSDRDANDINSILFRNYIKFTFYSQISFYDFYENTYNAVNLTTYFCFKISKYSPKKILDSLKNNYKIIIQDK